MKSVRLLGAVSSLAVSVAIAGGRPMAQRQCDSSPLLVQNTTVWTRDGLLTGRDVLFRDGRLVAHSGEGYELSRTGNELLALFLPLHTWAEEWASGLKSGGTKSARPASRPTRSSG